MKKEYLSVFDLDHTLLQENSSYQFGRYLYAKKAVPSITLLYCAWCYFRHKYLGLSIVDVQKKIFKRLFQNLSFLYLNSYLCSFLDENLERMLYLPAVARLQDAKENAHYIVILSSAPDFLVKGIADRLGAHEVKGTKYEVDADNCLSSISHYVQGIDKAMYVRDLAKRFSIPKENIFAYSDSYLDLPFLEEAGTPFGVNPDKKLLLKCKQNNWKII